MSNVDEATKFVVSIADHGLALELKLPLMRKLEAALTDSEVSAKIRDVLRTAEQFYLASEELRKLSEST